MEMQNSFTEYQEAAKHRPGHTDIDKSPVDGTPKRVFCSLPSSLSLTKRCEKNRHYKANTLTDPRAINMKKTAQSEMHALYLHADTQILYRRDSQQLLLSLPQYSLKTSGGLQERVMGTTAVQYSGITNLTEYP